jgi:hypothetical protein
MLDVLQLGGNCPVQGDGILSYNGEEIARAYFRARGAAWEVEVWATPRPAGEGCDPYGMPDADPDWWHGVSWGVWPDAGWMSERTALRLFWTACVLWYEREVLAWRS